MKFHYLDETNDKLCVQHENGLVLPRVFTVQIDSVQDVFDQGVGHNRQEDGVLKAERQLHGGALGHGRVVGVGDEVDVQHGQEDVEGDDADVEQHGDGGGPLHEVHPVLGQPVEGL